MAEELLRSPASPPTGSNAESLSLCGTATPSTPSAWQTGSWRALCASAGRSGTPRRDAALASFPARLHPVEPPGPRRPARSARETVDLLFFPTGGGKTEAYSVSRPSPCSCGGCATGREGARGGRGERDHAIYAAAAHARFNSCAPPASCCALELERERDSVRYGGWPFEIGLWSGGCDAQHPRTQRGRAIGFGTRQGAAVQGRLEGRPRLSARELPVVRDALRA